MDYKNELLKLMIIREISMDFMSDITERFNHLPEHTKEERAKEVVEIINSSNSDEEIKARLIEKKFFSEEETSIASIKALSIDKRNRIQELEKELIKSNDVFNDEVLDLMDDEIAFLLIGLLEDIKELEGLMRGFAVGFLENLIHWGIVDGNKDVKRELESISLDSIRLEYYRSVVARVEQVIDYVKAIKDANENRHEIMEIVYDSNDKAEAEERIASKYGYTLDQARAILDRRIYTCTKAEVEKIEKEYNDYFKELNSYMKQIDDLRGKMELLGEPR